LAADPHIVMPYTICFFMTPSIGVTIFQLRLLADALERDKYEGQQLYHQYREEFLKIKNTQSEALKAARDAAAAAAASKQEEEAKSAWTQAEVALFIQAFNKVCAPPTF
jgi:hypothetical protein